MRYDRELTLLPCSAADLRLAVRVPFRDLPDDRLLLYDAEVSEFWFEFDPQQDAKRFLQHAHFGCIANGQFLMCREDLVVPTALSAIDTPPLLVVPSGGVAPLPLRFNVDHEALAEAGRADDWVGRVAICSCGIAGCMSQYGWFQGGTCLALFSIDGGSLASVHWRPFRLSPNRLSQHGTDLGGGNVPQQP